jgi:hypothetical protein
MSDEQRKEGDVEGHFRRVGANDEPVEDAQDEGEDEVEAHLKFSNVRMD